MEMDSELKAGRALDAIIAEKVMGWERIEGDIATIWSLDNSAYDFQEVPKYSADIAAALQVYDKAFGEELHICLRKIHGEWRVDRHWFEDGHEAIASAPTLALAICRAALQGAA